MPVLLACLLAASAGALFATEPQAPAGGVRVAVILGNGPKATDEPTTMQTARCLKGFELYKNGTVNKLVVTGGFTFDYISEARMMKIALVTWGVAPDDVVEDEMAATTIENGLFSSKIFEQRGWAKNAKLVTQKFHMERSVGIFKNDGFQVQEEVSADAAAKPEDFAQVPDMKVDAAPKVEASDLLVVYEPYRSTDPMPWPTTAMAHRLRVAAALYHAKAAPSVVLFNDPYTRGPVNLSQMMKIALVSLGVPAADIKAVGRREFRRMTDLAAAYGSKSATVLAPATAKGAVDAVTRWKLLPVD